MSNSRNLALDSLRELSDSCLKAHTESLDIVCPIISGMCFSINELSKNSKDITRNFGEIYPKFQKREEVRSYLNDLFKEAIFADSKYELERDRLFQENNTSFMDFYNQRINGRDDIHPPGPRLKDPSRRSQHQVSLSLHSHQGQSSNGLVFNGSIPNRSASFQSSEDSDEERMSKLKLKMIKEESRSNHSQYSMFSRGKQIRFFWFIMIIFAESRPRKPLIRPRDEISRQADKLSRAGDAESSLEFLEMGNNNDAQSVMTDRGLSFTSKDGHRINPLKAKKDDKPPPSECSDSLNLDDCKSRESYPPTIVYVFFARSK